jgi:hypothetical protein
MFSLVTAIFLKVIPAAFALFSLHATNPNFQTFHFLTGVNFTLIVQDLDYLNRRHNENKFQIQTLTTQNRTNIIGQ